MPYCNIIPVTHAGLACIGAYLVDSEHQHHIEYKLTALEFFGVKNLEEFIIFTDSSMKANAKPLGRMRAGGPPKYAARWIIVRTPDYTDLSDEEWLSYKSAAMGEAGGGTPVVGMLNIHKNRLFLSADLNLVCANFDAGGHLIRDRNSHPIKSLRYRIDQTTANLNEIRKSLGRPLIQTIQEVQTTRRQERGEMDVVEELARLPKPPKKVEELRSALLLVGCKVHDFSLEQDYVSIVTPGKKRKKPKRFSIRRLLAAVAQAFLRLIEELSWMKKTPEEINKPII